MLTIYILAGFIILALIFLAGYRFRLHQEKRMIGQLTSDHAQDIGRGYELGYRMGLTETSNRGFIMGPGQDPDVESFLRREGIIR